MNQPRVILFDIDNVLVQALGSAHWREVVAQVKRRFNVEMTYADFRDRIYYLDNKDDTLSRLSTGELPAEEYLKLVKRQFKSLCGVDLPLTLLEYYELIFDDRTKTPVHDAESLGHEIRAVLSAHHFPLKNIGLITDRISGDEIVFHALIEKLYGDLFNFNSDYAFYSSSVGASKRNGSLFDYVITKLQPLGIKPADILVIDDRRSNLDLAKKAGMRTEEYVWGSNHSMTEILTRHLT